MTSETVRDMTARFYRGLAIFQRRRHAGRRVLIIAELDVPQCRKYRVAQRCEHLRYIGYDARVVHWRDSQAAAAAIDTATHVVLFRVPGTSAVLDLIDRARLRAIPTFWEADDLVFDADAVIANANLDALSDVDRHSMVADAALFRQALLHCPAAIASTPALARAMGRVHPGPIATIENGLDDETLRHAMRLRPGIGQPRPDLRIFYGAGSNTHDADLQQAAAGLAHVLARHRHARFILMGPVALPALLQPFAGQIERLPLQPFGSYLEVCARCDIAIAPLSPSAFSDAKSPIKFIEAASLGVPLVASASGGATALIRHGRDGLIAQTIDDWAGLLEGLVTDPRRRVRIGAAARRRVIATRNVPRIATTQVAAAFA